MFYHVICPYTHRVLAVYGEALVRDALKKSHEIAVSTGTPVSMLLVKGKCRVGEILPADLLEDMESLKKARKEAE